jgi:hypothetical protein
MVVLVAVVVILHPTHLVPPAEQAPQVPQDKDITVVPGQSGQVVAVAVQAPMVVPLLAQIHLPQVATVA